MHIYEDQLKSKDKEGVKFETSSYMSLFIDKTTSAIVYTNNSDLC